MVSAVSKEDIKAGGLSLEQTTQANQELLRARRLRKQAQTEPESLFNHKAGQQLIVVSCYTNFKNLAHGPRGKEALHSLYTYSLNPNTGSMTLVSVVTDKISNPAFLRFHPTKNLLYSCTESISEHGEVDTWEVCPESGRLSKVGSMDAQGTSTCYLTLDKECQNMLVVNYWDASIGVFELSPQGSLASVRTMHDPNGGKGMAVSHKRHVNHSQNDENAQKERQLDPHSHAIVLEPEHGKIAYVPDLGMDVIRQFRYDSATGSLEAAGTTPSGPPGRRALGPRYIEFHQSLPVCYVVNELSSEVSVFRKKPEAMDALAAGGRSDGSYEPTLELVQTIRTTPEAFPTECNTCGRITVHKSGAFVLVSNRGHDSITVFRVHTEAEAPGMLSVACVQHTRGKTPRHFQFDASGQWLIAANQDSDSLSIFHFNQATGVLRWSGNEYTVPSPNFVCSVVPHAQPVTSVKASTSQSRTSKQPEVAPAYLTPMIASRL
mmetsp:Transcript_28692/g.66570  ORF Transcript_28692/g.66570 Transcript_28692/m.66570 type:complete len:491 (+) Transcript_28692:99-1571(+)